jgi:hypothetical protein
MEVQQVFWLLRGGKEKGDDGRVRISGFWDGSLNVIVTNDEDTEVRDTLLYRIDRMGRRQVYKIHVRT